MENHGLKLTPQRRQVLHDNDQGVYLWRVRVENGRPQYLSDGEDHFLMIQATYGDEAAKRKLARVVAAEGVNEGEPVFFPGHRPVNDEEWEEQRMRFEFGLEPDPLKVLDK